MRLEKFQSFIIELRQSDDTARKTRWLWGSVTVSFLLVLFLWLTYMSYELKSLALVPSPAAEPGVIAKIKAKP